MCLVRTFIAHACVTDNVIRITVGGKLIPRRLNRQTWRLSYKYLSIPSDWQQPQQNRNFRFVALPGSRWLCQWPATTSSLTRGRDQRIRLLNHLWHWASASMLDHGDIRWWSEWRSWRPATPVRFYHRWRLPWRTNTKSRWCTNMF